MRAVIFDLDGTLVDTVCAHTLAWQRVLREAELRIEGWKVHLHGKGIAYGIATSGKREDVKPSLSALDIPQDVVVVDRSDVERAQAGAYRVYANPAELLGSIYQLGLRGE